MCLSIPAKVLSVDGQKTCISLGGAEYNAALDLVENVKVGDYVLLHSGFVIQIIDEKEARETMELFNEIIQKGKE
ncbi:MAG: HypC/HybG/HupF family hydrogenase formation chaperone [Bacteroidota bacterium]|nr:HypC/HybG/HupF family hydrogenase formation chaperone [Odoribacter sp.]MDP3641991.1 HypC/HybG/HupF family hydrogenase formation chaperone [Bacteroidota bacterium]